MGSVSVLAAAILWGTTGTAASFAPDVSPLAIGAVAMGFGGMLQALLAAPLLVGHAERLRSRSGLVLTGALAVAVYPLCFYSSMHLAGVAVGTAVSIGLAPLAAALLERVTDRRELTGRWCCAAVLGVAGVTAICVAEAAGISGSQSTSATEVVVGVGLGLLAAATYAAYSWAAHGLISGGVPSRATMGAIFGLGGLCLVPVLIVTGGPLSSSWSNAAVGLYMAVVPMFAGYVLFGWGLAHLTASTATTLTLLEPAVAAALAVLVVVNICRSSDGSASPW